METALLLLDEGCDPNSQCDQGRSPLWRAAYLGNLDLCRQLLEAGGDPRLRAATETPWHVAANPPVKALLAEWDVGRTDLLIKTRQQEMQAKMDARLQTAADREAYAREQFAKELVAFAEAGDVELLSTLLERLYTEAIQNREKPRGKAETRDQHGNSASTCRAREEGSLCRAAGAASCYGACRCVCASSWTAWASPTSYTVCACMLRLPPTAARNRQPC